MDTVDVLRRAKEILSDPNRWNREGGFAQDASGRQLQTADQLGGVKWCAIGAICRDAGWAHSLYDDPAVTAVVAATGLGSWVRLTIWNDRVATHAELIDAFDRAMLSLAPETSPGTFDSQSPADAGSDPERGTPILSGGLA